MTMNSSAFRVIGWSLAAGVVSGWVILFFGMQHAPMIWKLLVICACAATAATLDAFTSR
jgi:hypothetical protein